MIGSGDEMAVDHACVSSASSMRLDHPLLTTGEVEPLSLLSRLAKFVIGSGDEKAVDHACVSSASSMRLDHPLLMIKRS